MDGQYFRTAQPVFYFSFGSLTGCVAIAAWRAPETFTVAGGKQEVSFKTDVYMFGVVILEVATGTEPFHWLSSGEAIAMYRGRNPANIINPYDAALLEGQLTSVMADTPARNALLLLAQWCMKLSPADRPSLDGVMRCLDDIRSRRAVLETHDQMQSRYGVGAALALAGSAELMSRVTVLEAELVRVLPLLLYWLILCIFPCMCLCVAMREKLDVLAGTSTYR